MERRRWLHVFSGLGSLLSLRFIDSLGCHTQSLVVALHHSFEYLTHILGQVNAICHLYRLWCFCADRTTVVSVNRNVALPQSACRYRRLG